jgi:hypothetical protein
LSYVYFEDELQWQMSMKRLSRDEARRIADALPKTERGKLDHKALAVRWKVSSPG